MSIRAHLLALGRDAVLAATDRALAARLGCTPSAIRTARSGLDWGRPRSGGRPRAPDVTREAAERAVETASKGKPAALRRLTPAACARALEISPQALRARIKSARKRAQNGGK